MSALPLLHQVCLFLILEEAWVIVDEKLKETDHRSPEPSSSSLKGQITSVNSSKLPGHVTVLPQGCGDERGRIGKKPGSPLFSSVVH
jgi:hypothetical protein